MASEEEKEERERLRLRLRFLRDQLAAARKDTKQLERQERREARKKSRQ